MKQMLGGEDENPGAEDGVHGPSFPNGKPSEEYTFKNGNEHGIHRLWYENGQLKCEISYYRGKMNGRMRIWAEDGMLYGQSYYLMAVQFQRRATRQNAKRFRDSRVLRRRRLPTLSAIM